jgi:polyhydroxyalkanoate synthesis regulator phasin
MKPMTKLTLQEATSHMHSYGMKCDKDLVEEWVKKGKIRGTEVNGSTYIEEDGVHEFLHHYQWKGTAYEKGINDETKVNRLLDEIDELRQKIEQLQNEKKELQIQLVDFGVMPF